ncbi:TetR family transcriptional regulator [Glaciibacter psychrotolerans]|uniref:AcrR family transcriptional regulator n=1 Tax=Glaciibacter psychrotolerans TaxID=670054 RepID=A0A7Z0J536_9MICO|nr:TetR family transcriptional regulator [Leifsonia psychrotolerans]NYJ18980.1 AcrR family transcriptional regulator [Leifsonia psychrotolerans]
MNALQTDHSFGRTGRPNGSSRAMLQEAAAELFLEQGYRATNIEQITRRAGVSRNTFFNYFPAKSDLLWVEVDQILSGLPAALAAATATARPAETDAVGPVPTPVSIVRTALLALADEMAPGQVPWALTQYDLMGTTTELQASALPRFTVQADVLARSLEHQTARVAGDPLCRAFAAAVCAAVGVAALGWARSGVQRGSLAPSLASAIDPVCAGFDALLPTG